MSADAALADRDVEPSVAWAAAEARFGPTCVVWEPDTFRIELRRAGLERDGLVAKLLGAQTIKCCDAFVHDHVALFQFALACDGVPAAGDATPHPTVVQLCWAVREFGRLADRVPDDEDGFDPAYVDPALAVVMALEGFAVPPKELEFAREALDRMTHATPQFRAEVEEAWRPLASLPPEALRAKAAALGETAVDVQVTRLADVRLEMEAREARRARQRRAF